MPLLLTHLPTEIHRQIISYLGAHPRYELSCTNRRFRILLGPLSSQIAETHTYPRFHLTAIRLGQDKFHRDEWNSWGCCLNCRRYLPYNAFCYRDFLERPLLRACIDCLVSNAAERKQKELAVDEKVRWIQERGVAGERFKAVEGGRVRNCETVWQWKMGVKLGKYMPIDGREYL